MLRNCWSACTLTETCCYNTKRWINPYQGDKGRRWWEGEACFLSEELEAFWAWPYLVILPGLSPQTRSPSTYFTEMEWDEEESRIDVSGWRLLPMTRNLVPGASMRTLGSTLRGTTVSAVFKELSCKWDQSRGLGTGSHYRPHRWLFSPRPVWDVKPQHAGHAPVWIIRLGLADFPLPLQLNKVFLQTRCPNLCYAAVGY